VISVSGQYLATIEVDPCSARQPNAVRGVCTDVVRIALVARSPLLLATIVILGGMPWICAREARSRASREADATIPDWLKSAHHHDRTHASWNEVGASIYPGSDARSKLVGTWTTLDHEQREVLWPDGHRGPRNVIACGWTADADEIHMRCCFREWNIGYRMLGDALYLNGVAYVREVSPAPEREETPRSTF
jgi:hypothetical protein